MGEVAVAVALELVPAVVTALRVWEVRWECEGDWRWAKPHPAGHEHSQCTRERAKPEVTVGTDHPSFCPHPPEALPPCTPVIPPLPYSILSLLQEGIQLEIITPTPLVPTLMSPSLIWPHPSCGPGNSGNASQGGLKFLSW